MKIKYTDVLNSSVEWTKAVLLRPFNMKKWVILTFVALMAGTLMNNSFNFQIPSSASKDKKVQSEKVIKATPEADKKAPASRLSLPLIVLIVFVVMAFAVLFTWLSSRFDFVFLDNIVKNNASIKIPFRANRKIGNSLFLFNLAMIAVFFISLGVLFLPFILILWKTNFSGQDPAAALMQIFSVSAPLLVLFFILIVIFGFVVLVANDFIVPVMYRDKIGFTKAYAQVRPIIMESKFEVLIYCLIKSALGLGIGIASMIIAFLAILALILPVLILAVLLYGVYLILPAPAQLIFAITSLIITLPVLGFIFMLSIWCLNLPFAVFMRIFSLKFISRLAPRYNLFKLDITPR